MLPFLDRKKTISLIMSKRAGKPDTEVANEVESPGSPGVSEDLKVAAEDLLRAVESKSVIDIAKALQAAHDVCESYEQESEPEGAA